ncbi:MAG TPA: DUF2255 family protein [Vicinamibacterales bacterium]|nr:DUF2255 family protein [Vicinamibacterales bacterium]
MRVPRFSRSVLAAIDAQRIVGVRAGREHRFTGVWALVVGGRVFVRSWNDKPHGWRRAFLADPLGALNVSGREIRVRARRARGARLMEAIEHAYGQKHATPSSRKYVRGFARARRRLTTTELLPRG